MKLYIGAIASLASLTLMGCQTTNTGTPLPANVAQAEALVIQTTQQFCSFVPAVSSVANLIKQNDPTLTTVEALARAICSVVGSPPTTVATGAVIPLKAAAPHVLNGVTITGYWKAK